jgi:hypothetical protein
MSPRALRDSVRPRRLQGASGRPLNLTLEANESRTSRLAACFALRHAFRMLAADAVDEGPVVLPTPATTSIFGMGHLRCAFRRGNWTMVSKTLGPPYLSHSWELFSFLMYRRVRGSRMRRDFDELLQVQPSVATHTRGLVLFREGRLFCGVAPVL